MYELTLNCMGFADLSRWPQRKIRVFINQVNEIVKRPRERNPITLCYNPVLVISLCCEFLLSIGRDIKIFEEEGKVLSRKLLLLGKKIISTMSEDVI
jgi:hypothetical protein